MQRNPHWYPSPSFIGAENLTEAITASPPIGSIISPELCANVRCSPVTTVLSPASSGGSRGSHLRASAAKIRCHVPPRLRRLHGERGRFVALALAPPPASHRLPLDHRLSPAMKVFTRAGSTLFHQAPSCFSALAMMMPSTMPRTSLALSGVTPLPTSVGRPAASLIMQM